MDYSFKSLLFIVLAVMLGGMLVAAINRKGAIWRNKMNAPANGITPGLATAAPTATPAASAPTGTPTASAMGILTRY